ncbi:TetR/AcrR family transcriptional regulator [Roseixanthobacter glucoisosaccharinicivorans]|uniref:TetR/AcrR family transcriptional regulator n=1 Tax=Roseixanthobacter glucoisosaccharinicivorans TaxID=3119923 RepID=UPI00372C8C92
MSRWGKSLERRALILERAGEEFLDRGFAEASMDQISDAVGCSKGTLYVYFGSKDELFAESITAEIARRVAITFSFAEPAGDVKATLRSIGCGYVAMFTDATVLAIYRSVIHERRRFPEIGRRFMDAGPRNARQMLSGYLADAAKAGALTAIADVNLAAQQFLALCQGQLLHDLLLGAAETPNRREIERQVDVALSAFFAIYPARSG